MKFSPLIVYSDHNELVKIAHSYFLKMVNTAYAFRSRPISFSVGKDLSVNCRTFVHLTTVEGSNGLRVFDAPRAIRIHWIGETFDQIGDKDIRFFSKYHGKAIRHYFLVPKYAYLVIIEENARGYFVVTAYHLDNSKRIASYMKEYRNYKRKGAPL